MLWNGRSSKQSREDEKGGEGVLRQDIEHHKCPEEGGGRRGSTGRGEVLV